MAPTPPTKRTLRSGSVPSTGNAEDIKTFIANSQQMVISSLTKELEEVKGALSTFVARISALEDKINSIMSSNKDITFEVKVLKERVHNLEAFSVEDCISEAQSRMSRAENIIIQGAPEKDSGSLEDRLSHDKELVQDILREIGIDHANKSSTAHNFRPQRIGKKRDGGFRLLKVKVNNPEQKREILRSAKRLKNSDTFSRVFIRQDLTPMQQQKEKLLQKELHERKQLGENVVIYKGKVQNRQNLPIFR